MGLDQIAVMFTAEEAGDIQTDIREVTQFKPVYRWRKHPNLHGWMEALYRAKGGKKEEFNIATVRLDAVDLDQLEDAVKRDLLPETDGFLFGESQPEHVAQDLEFIARARAVIARGFVVFYDSWW